MDCPYCKKEMAQGAILNDRHVWWYPKEVTFIPLTPEEEGAVRLNDAGGWLDCARAESWYCADCRIVITPVPEIESSMDKWKKKWDSFTQRVGEESEKRQIAREEEKQEREKEKKRKKDPWEV